MDDKKMMKIKFILPSGQDNYERLVIHIKENHTSSSLIEFFCAWFGLPSEKCVFRRFALLIMVYLLNPTHFFSIYFVSDDVKENTMPCMAVHVPDEDEEMVEGGVSNVDQD